MNAPAPTKTGNIVPAVAGLAALVAMLIIGGQIINMASPDLGGDHEQQPADRDQQNRQLVILTAISGRFEDDRFKGSDRELTITYWVDGEQHRGDPDDNDGGTWHEFLSLLPGTEVRLLVEQHGEGGFLLCTISANGKTLLPNGYMHRNDAGDCDVEGIVPDE